MYEDIYCTPEKFGLRIVADFDLYDYSYEFDLIVVWQDVETGELYFGSDGGCSCPSPFDDYEGKDQLTKIVKMQTWHDAMGEILKENSTLATEKELSRMVEKIAQATLAIVEARRGASSSRNDRQNA